LQTCYFFRCTADVSWLAEDLALSIRAAAAEVEGGLAILVPFPKSEVSNPSQGATGNALSKRRIDISNGSVPDWPAISFVDSLVARVDREDDSSTVG